MRPFIYQDGRGTTEMVVSAGYGPRPQPLDGRTDPIHSLSQFFNLFVQVAQRYGFSTKSSSSETQKDLFSFFGGQIVMVYKRSFPGTRPWLIPHL